MLMTRFELYDQKKSENSHLLCLRSCCLALRCSQVSILGVHWPSLKMNANRLKQWNKQLNLNYMILWKSDAEKVKKSENSHLLCSRSCCPCIKKIRSWESKKIIWIIWFSENQIKKIRKFKLTLLEILLPLY